jgi:hypothetical protein
LKPKDLVDLNENFSNMKLPYTETLNETTDTVREENYDDDVIDELDFNKNEDSNYETHSDDEEQVTQLVGV